MLNRICLALQAFWLVLTSRNTLDLEATAKARTERIAELERDLEGVRNARESWIGVAYKIRDERDAAQKECQEAKDTGAWLHEKLTADAAEHDRDKQALEQARAEIGLLEAQNETVLSRYREAADRAVTLDFALMCANEKLQRIDEVQHPDSRGGFPVPAEFASVIENMPAVIKGPEFPFPELGKHTLEEVCVMREIDPASTARSVGFASVLDTTNCGDE